MLIKNICETQTLLGIMRRPVSLKEHMNAENDKFVRGHVGKGNGTRARTFCRRGSYARSLL